MVVVAEGVSSCRGVIAVSGSSEAVEESLGENSPDSESHVPLRANTTTQVCWHRMATVGMADMQAMLKVVRLNCCVLLLFYSYSLQISVKPCPHCLKKVRLLQKSATVAENGNSATVAVFCDSRTFLRQCRQGLRDGLISLSKLLYFLCCFHEIIMLD